jgi:CheY-like chemotaxis protein
LSRRNIEVNENRLLVMDDDPEVGAFFGQVGEDLGFDTKILSDPGQFGQTMLDFSPTVLLLDLQMPGRDGIELMRELSTLDRRPKVLIASGLDSRVLTTASELGISMGIDVAGAFCKPIALDELEEGHHCRGLTPSDRQRPARRPLPAEGDVQEPRALDHRGRGGARALGAPGVRAALSA